MIGISLLPLIVEKFDFGSCFCQYSILADKLGDSDRRKACDACKDDIGGMTADKLVSACIFVADMRLDPGMCSLAV